MPTPPNDPVAGVTVTAGEFSPEALNASLMKSVLRGTALFLAVVVFVQVPFFAANKPGAALLSVTAAIFMLGIPYVLTHRGRIRPAATIYVASGAAISAVLVLFGRTGVNSTFQLAITVVAAVLLGRSAALWSALFGLTVDFAGVVLELTGRHPPVYFPEPALSAWLLAALSFVLTAPILYNATRTLRQALEQVQKQLAEKHQAEEHLFYQAQLIVQSPDPVIAIDNHRVVTSWNAAAARLIGWSEQEALGKSLDEVVRYAPGSVGGGKVREALESTGEFRGELTWLTRSGSQIIVDSAIRILRDAAGNRIGIVGGFYDITERRRAEEALKRSEERLLLITETVPVGILVFDPAGKIVFANSPASSQMGLTPEQMTNRLRDDPAWNITDEAGNPVPVEQRPVQQVLKTRKPVFDFRAALLAQGKRIYLSISAAPILNGEGFVEGVVMAIEDVSSRRELEEKYQHAQKMESLGRLAGGVAHDFNNLLTVINGYSSLALRKTGADSQSKAPLEQILKAGEAAAELCQQLLAFSRRQATPPAAIALNDAVQQTEKMLQRLVGEDIEVATLLDPSAGTILADPGQVQQVLMNLVVNARDAMPQGGRLIISTGNYHSAQDDPARDGDSSSGDYVVLTVEDTGVGMDQETRQRIFEPFFTTKETGKGTGLGLSTIYGIVKQHGGWMRVESEPWKGARFSIYFRRMETAAATPAPVPHSSTGGSETVLVVEDQPAVREFLVESLKTYGYSVLDVGSGADALELGRRPDVTIDLLVTDMIMPGMSGRQLVERLAAVRPGLRVVLVSGYSSEQIEPLGLPVSQFAILRKPVSPQVLAEAVRGMLHGNAALETIRS